MLPDGEQKIGYIFFWGSCLFSIIMVNLLTIEDYKAHIMEQYISLSQHERLFTGFNWEIRLGEDRIPDQG